MAFIGFILFLWLIYWIFNSNDKLGDIDKSKKILNDFSSKLEEKVKSDSKNSTIIDNTPPIKPIVISSDFLKKTREFDESLEKKIEELGIAIDSDGTMHFDIDLNSIVFEEKIINFILIRYYLTGLKNFPNFIGFKNYLINLYGNLSDQSFHILWKKNVEKLFFDESKIKKINGLYHFTHKKNLQSILDNGLLTRSNLDKDNKIYIFNDENRWDGVENSISLSISHPNYKMFYKYRSKTNINDWVVLKISNDILTGSIKRSIDYFDKAIFCKTNAASFREKERSITERKTYKAFLDMFESPTGKGLKEYTFDNQAEILYQGNIPINFIEEIYVLDQVEQLSWVIDKGFNVTENKNFFDKR